MPNQYQCALCAKQITMFDGFTNKDNQIICITCYAKEFDALSEADQLNTLNFTNKKLINI